MKQALGGGGEEMQCGEDCGEERSLVCPVLFFLKHTHNVNAKSQPKNNPKSLRLFTVALKVGFGGTFLEVLI